MGAASSTWLDTVKYGEDEALAWLMWSDLQLEESEPEPSKLPALRRAQSCAFLPLRDPYLSHLIYFRAINGPHFTALCTFCAQMAMPWQTAPRPRPFLLPLISLAIKSVGSAPLQDLLPATSRPDVSVGRMPLTLDASVHRSQ